MLMRLKLEKAHDNHAAEAKPVFSFSLTAIFRSWKERYDQKAITDMKKTITYEARGKVTIKTYLRSKSAERDRDRAEDERHQT